MKLTDEEVTALREYFLKRAGYVSHEFDPIVINLIRKLDKAEEKEDDKDKKTEEINNIRGTSSC